MSDTLKNQKCLTQIKYTKTITVSQFAKELKAVADKGIDYTLENCEITYDPVRGFTKYVAIIEGFIGWFLLSIFLVSLLNQIINI